jgi:NAD(P)H-nitrite reductase large subunit
MKEGIKAKNLPKGVILQRDGETYGIKPHTPMGTVTPELLVRIASVVQKYRISVIKFTSAQRLLLAGINESDLDAVLKELSEAGELSPHYVQACPGTDICGLGLADSMSLGRRLDELIYSMDLPAKVKVGVSGCPRSCAESWVKDIGILADSRGWKVFFGGNAGARPRFADLMVEEADEERVVEIVKQLLALYKGTGKPKERTARFVERMGADVIRERAAGAMNQLQS